MNPPFHELSPETGGQGDSFHTRRLFSGRDHLLVVEYTSSRISHFRLYSGLTSTERTCLQWDAAHGIRAHQINSGDDSPLKNLKPLLEHSLPLVHQDLLEQWHSLAATIDPAIHAFVADRLAGTSSPVA